MKQILHIFKKDTRRFWPEILLSVVVAIAFVLVVPGEWTVSHDPGRPQRISQFAGILAVLLAVSWWVMIARVIFDETLVGDRQFWITRPYEWTQLLSAKTLFFAVWIGVPYVLTETYLIAAAGYPPLAYVAGVLAHVALIAMFFVLPVFALATVTSNFGRLTLTMLGVVVVIVGFLFVINGVRAVYTAANPYSNAVMYPLLICGCAAVIVIEYATRRTWLTRGVLIVLPILLALSVVAYRRQSLVDRAYARPEAGAQTLIHFSSIPTPQNMGGVRSWNGQDYIDLPAQYSGVPDGTLVIFDDVRFTLTAADGSHWTSPWQGVHEHILPGTKNSAVHLPAIRPDIYDTFKGRPVTLEITVAASRYQGDSLIDTAFPNRGAEVAVPGLGVCEPDAYRPAMLRCRAPLHPPRLTYATVQWSKTPCVSPSASSTADAWIEHEDSDPTPLIASVWDRNVWFDAGDNERHGQVCEGSPLRITQYHLLDRRQLDFTLQNFVLPSKVEPT
jgi:hypothetical protein